MKARSGVAAWLLYIAVRTAFAVLQVFPIEWNLRTARRLAKLWPRIMPRHRNRAIEHLTLAFDDTTGPVEIQRLADRCLENVAMFAVEAVCLPRLINAFTRSRYVRLVDFNEALDLIVSGRGVILVTGHYGSFELTGHLLAALGFDVTAVMRPLDNVYLNRFVVQARRTHGLTLLDKKGAMTHSRGILKEGGLLAFIGDQDAGRKGLFVEFFGRPASTYKSIGLLAMWTQCPIVVGYARRRGISAQYDVGIQRIIYPQEWESQSDPLRWITQTYTSAIEAMVCVEPEQYLWIHRRWKSQPQNRP
jgi:KDO2-lipid IV(A) lauroyltransferase